MPLKFLKLGGSLITDKSADSTLRRALLDAVARSVARACEKGRFRFLIGHGGGSFGHFPARRYAVREGLAGGGGWVGFHQTRRAMLDLDRDVVGALRDAGLPAVPVQPSSACTARDGEIESFAEAPIRALLDAGAVPVIFGDAVPDIARGFTILSTECFFLHLAALLRPASVTVLSDVPGILDRTAEEGAAPVVLPRFDRKALASFEAAEGVGPDVTGGMASKARLLLDIAEALPEAEVRLLSGLDPAAVESALLGRYEGGTIFQA